MPPTGNNEAGYSAIACCAAERGMVKFHFQAIISFVTESCRSLSSSTIFTGTSYIAKWLECFTEKNLFYMNENN